MYFPLLKDQIIMRSVPQSVIDALPKEKYVELDDIELEALYEELADLEMPYVEPEAAMKLPLVKASLALAEESADDDEKTAMKKKARKKVKKLLIL